MKKLIALPLLLLALTLFSQTTDSLLNNIILRECNRPSPAGLYLHLDKTTYVQGENIWFTAYGPQDSINALYVCLADRVTGKVVLYDRFAGFAGITKGYFFIADSIITGEYMFIAYTNDFPAGLFTLPISIRSAKKPYFNLATHLSDSAITCNVSLPAGGLAIAGDFTYRLYGWNNQLISSGIKKTDNFGEVTIPLPDSCRKGKVNLLARVRQAGKSANFVIPIITTTDKLTASFFPEGGSIVAGHPTKVIIDLKALSGKATSTQGCLQDESGCVAAFKTDVYGRGQLDFIPEAGKKYSLVTEDNQEILQEFPTVKPDGYTIRITKAVIRDSLFCEIYPSRSDTNCILLIHNNNWFYNVIRFTVSKAGGKVVVPCANFPSGAAYITLMDEKGNFQADRSIWIEHRENLSVTFQADSSSYHKRSKIILKVKVTNTEGQGIKSFFSASAFFAKRLDSTIVTAIGRPGNFNTRQLEQFLIIQKRERSNNPPLVIGTDLYGQVIYNGKAIDRSATVWVKGFYNTMCATDNKGYFKIPFERQVDSAERKISIRLMNDGNIKVMDGYAIALGQFDYKRINDSLASLYYPFEKIQKDSLSIEEKNSVAKVLPEAKVLSTVVVDALKDRDPDFTGEFYSKTCNDYVCMYNILNCGNHRSGRQPIDGEMVLYHGHLVTYHGCKGDDFAKYMPPAAYLTNVPAVHFAKDYFVADYSKYNPSDPEVNTTIYWNYLAITDENGEATLSFYTNDLAGRFCLRVEGISSIGLISGKYYFRVVD